MSIFNEYPYTNFHELNLDWVVAKIKELSDQWDIFSIDWEKRITEEVTKWLDEHPEATTTVQDNSLTAAKFVASLRERIMTDYAKETEFKALKNLVNNLDQDLTTAEGNIDTNTGNINALSARVDTFASLPAGSTAGNAELLDIRVGYHGGEYPSAGTAVRKQIGNLAWMLETSVADIINYEYVLNEYVDNLTGQIISYEGWNRTGYIPVDPSRTMFISVAGSTNAPYCAEYDQNHTYIRGFQVNSGTYEYNFPSEVKYIMISGLPAVFPLTIFYGNGNRRAAAEDNDILLNKPFGIMPLDGWIQGTLTSEGVLSGNAYRITSPFIPVSGDTIINMQWTGEKAHIWVVEYDQNQNFVKYSATAYTSDYKYGLMANTRYIRLVALKPGGTAIIVPNDSTNLGIKITTEEKKKFKVMSFNVGHYDYGTGVGLPAESYNEKLINWRRFLGEYNDIDVMGIQEYDTRMDAANTIWSDDVLWNHYFPYEVVTGMETAIKSRDYIGRNYLGQLSTGRYYTAATVDGVYFISVHLTPGVDNAAIRTSEVNDILTIIGDHSRFVIFGDFNCEPGEETALYKKFTDAGYNIANCGWFGKYWTWTTDQEHDMNDYENPEGTVYYIDNIITSSDIKIVNAKPINDYNKLSSDHLPLYAELVID